MSFPLHACLRRWSHSTQRSKHEKLVVLNDFASTPKYLFLKFTLWMELGLKVRFSKSVPKFTVIRHSFRIILGINSSFANLRSPGHREKHFYITRDFFGRKNSSKISGPKIFGENQISSPEFLSNFHSSDFGNYCTKFSARYRRGTWF